MAKLLASIVPLVDVLRNTETDMDDIFATTSSGLPSPSRSPMATFQGDEPVAKSTLAAKLPETMLPLADVLRNTEMVFEPIFATTMSGLPSPSRSPMAEDIGVDPAVKSTLGETSLAAMADFTGSYVGLNRRRLAPAKDVPVFSRVMGA